MAEFFCAAGDLVKTPYGECVVDSVREAPFRSVLCTPVAWKLADYSSSQPRFFLNPKDVRKKLLMPGDLIKCPYGGAGKILEVRQYHYKVALDNWQLADKKSPTLYLMHSAVTADIEAQKAAAEQKRKRSQWNNMLTIAVSNKDKAAALFKKKDYEGAKKAYLDALSALNNLGTELPDSFRAEVLEHTIPCHNNIALCSMKNKQYDEAIAYANNGVMLVDALDGQINKGAGAAHGGSGERKLSMVWMAFKRRGMTYEKLIRDWKKKSLFYKGKAAYLAKEFDIAIDNLAMALAVLNTPLEGSVAWALATCDGNSAEVSALVDPNLYMNTTGGAEGKKVEVKRDAMHEKQVKELADLLALAKQDKKRAEKKERNTWSKAFEKTADAPLPAAEDNAGRSAPAAPPVTPNGTAALPIAAAPVSTGEKKATIDVSKYLSAKTGTAPADPSRRPVAGVGNISPASSSAGAAAKLAAEAVADESDSDSDSDDDYDVAKGSSVLDQVPGGGWGIGAAVAAVAGLAFVLSRPKN